MSTSIREIPLGRPELVKLVRQGGSEQGIGRMRALAALRQSPAAETTPLFAELAVDGQQLSRFRHMAVMGLYELGGDAGQRALAEIAERVDKPIVADVALGLGRIGAADQLDLVEQLADRAPEHLKAQANFGATLLAYRHRLPSRTVKPPPDGELLELGRGESRSIRLKPADAATAKLALEALGRRPLGVSLVDDSAQLILCEPNTFIWAWSKEALSGGLGALDTKAVAGALFRQNEFDKSFSLSAIALATPERGALALTLHRPDSGRVMYAGRVNDDGNLSLQSLRHPGAVAIALKAHLEDGGRLAVATAESGVRTEKRKIPERG